MTSRVQSTAHKSLRQQPTSCSSCRKKKLRCNRQQPCSNCAIRGVPCEFQLGNQRIQPLVDVLVQRGSTIPQSGFDSVEERLSRLEAAVFEARHAEAKPFNEERPLVLTSLHHNSQENVAEEDEIATDSAWLLRADARRAAQDESLKGFVNSFTSLTIVTLSEIDAAAQEPQSICPRVLIPHRRVCQDLFEIYTNSMHSMQYILYIPTTLQLMEDLYDDIERSIAPTSFGNIALVITLLASVSAFWSWGAPRNERYASLHPHTLHIYWLDRAMEVLDTAARIKVTPSLEMVQASILVVFMLFRLDGSCARLQHYHNAAITAAKAMGLNTVDLHSSVTKKPTTIPQIVELEMKRRVWWHLCSSDWCFPFVSDGLPNVASTIHEQYMRVRKPRNINDSDLLNQDADFERSSQEETSMTYYLHRIRMGQICKEISDMRWSTRSLQLVQIPYGQILSIDQKFAILAADFPVYNPPLGLPFDPALSQQKSFARLTTLALKAKLHLPFMLRAGRNRAYEYSRKVALECARTMLQMSSMLPTVSSSAEIRRPLSLTGTLHHFFFACIVLVMDVCANPAEGDREERITEIMAACNVLLSSKTTSEPAASFNTSLAAILYKYGLTTSAQELSQQTGELQDPESSYDDVMIDENDLLGLQGTLSEFLDFDNMSTGMQW